MKTYSLAHTPYSITLISYFYPLDNKEYGSFKIWRHLGRFGRADEVGGRVDKLPGQKDSGAVGHVGHNRSFGEDKPGAAEARNRPSYKADRRAGAALPQNGAGAICQRPVPQQGQRTDNGAFQFSAGLYPGYVYAQRGEDHTGRGRA